MQLGTRWAAGTIPPPAVPAELHAAIRRAEEQSGADERSAWTLTWLEGKPVAELDTGWEVVMLGDAPVARPWES